MFSVSFGFDVIGTGIPGTHQRCHQRCQECPIYAVFDWNMPMMTTIITAFVLVGYAVLAGIYTAFAPWKKYVGWDLRWECKQIQMEQCKGIKRIEKQLRREPIFRMTSCMTFNVVVSILAMPWGDSLEVKRPLQIIPSHHLCWLLPRSVAANAASPRPWEKWKPKMDLRTLRRLRTLPRMGWDRHFFSHPKILDDHCGADACGMAMEWHYLFIRGVSNTFFHVESSFCWCLSPAWEDVRGDAHVWNGLNVWTIASCIGSFCVCCYSHWNWLRLDYLLSTFSLRGWSSPARAGMTCNDPSRTFGHRSPKGRRMSLLYRL